MFLSARAEPSANIVKTLETLPPLMALDIRNMKADFTGASGVPTTSILSSISVTLSDKIGTKQITGFMTIGNFTNEKVLLGLLDEIITKYPNAEFKFGGTVPDLSKEIKEKISVMLDEIYVKKDITKQEKLEIPAIPGINNPGEYIKSKSALIILLHNQEDYHGTTTQQFGASPEFDFYQRLFESSPEPIATTSAAIAPEPIATTLAAVAPIVTSEPESTDDLTVLLPRVSRTLGEQFDRLRVNKRNTTRRNRYYTVRQLKKIAYALNLSPSGIKSELVERIVNYLSPLGFTFPQT